MRRSRLCFAGLVIAALAATPGYGFAQSDPAQKAEEPSDPQRAAFQIFAKHLRANFEDIHEVSMRFHNIDPTLNGMMVIELTWADGRLQSASVVENETNAEEAAAILEVLRRWEIEELVGPVTFTIPFRFRIVGSDDPTFAEKGILTGKVTDTSGAVIAGALIELTSKLDDLEPIRVRTNREGVFIRTLIPPGTWDVHCVADGFVAGTITALTLDSGEHKAADFELESIAAEKKTRRVSPARNFLSLTWRLPDATAFPF